MRKKWISIICAVIIMVCTIITPAYAAGIFLPEEINTRQAESTDLIEAPSGILMEAQTGTVVYQKDADTRRSPASITKIMTLILIFDALDYYTNEEITIPLDPTMTPAENSKKYFDKYGKLKRTEEALTEQIADTRSEIEHLESVSNALDIALAESDLAQIKEELMEYGYIKKHYDRRKGQKAQSKSKPFHYVTEDGYDIYVGKNNFQNDELTFKFATGNDWWFHAKKMAGSHVVVKSKDGELPDHIFEIAGQLAAYYSKGRTAPKVEIDYIQKKQVKKPAGAKPGFVVYYTNYSLMAEPSLKGVREV